MNRHFSIGPYVIHAIVLWLAFIGGASILFVAHGIWGFPSIINYLIDIIIACVIFSPVIIQYFSWSKLLTHARHDSLTGLFNRSSFNKHFTEFINRGQKFQLVMIDLCKFKSINDTYGHRVGDDVLKVVATRIQNILRPGDILARLGGDEFVILLPGEISDAEFIDLIKSIEEPMQISDINLSIGLSVSITAYPDNGTDHVTLMTQADNAMYYAKKNGISVFSGNLGDMSFNRVRA